MPQASISLQDLPAGLIFFLSPGKRILSKILVTLTIWDPGKPVSNPPLHSTEMRMTAASRCTEGNVMLMEIQSFHPLSFLSSSSVLIGVKLQVSSSGRVRKLPLSKHKREKREILQGMCSPQVCGVYPEGGIEVMSIFSSGFNCVFQYEIAVYLLIKVAFCCCRCSVF